MAPRFLGVSVSPPCDHMFVPATLAFDELDTFPVSATARADHGAHDGHPSLRQVVSCTEQLGGLVAGLDADQVPLSEALRWWETFNRIERLAAAAETLLAARVEQSRAWQRSGCRSAAEQLAWISGTGIGRARDQLATSKALEHLPATTEAVRGGKLSGAQTSEITAAAAVNAAAEKRLLDVASHDSLAELHNEALRARAAGDPDPDSTHRRIHTNRQLRTFTDPEGAWNLHARGPAHTGALIERALDELVDRIYRSRRTAEHEPREAYAYDALLGLAGHPAGRHGRTVDPATAATAAHTDGACAGSTTDTERDADSPVETQPETQRETQHSANPGNAWPRSERYLALLRIDIEALARGTRTGEELCEITGIGPIPVDTARRLLGDAVLKLVITRGNDVVNVTHLGRGPTTAQRIALLWQSPTCSVEGCASTHVEIDHSTPWAETRVTRLDQLDHLCDSHHDMKHRRGWALIPGTGPRPFVPPDDARHPRSRPP